MSPPSSIECPDDEGSPSTSNSPISKLLQQLEHACADAKPTKRFRFPDQLLDALLRTQVTLETSDLSRIASETEESRHKLISSLQTDSLRCLSLILLCSSVAAEQESGLYLLLNANNPKNTNTAIPQPKLRSRSRSFLIRDRLISTLYPIFDSQKAQIQLRRLTGKILLELLLELRDDAGSSSPAQEIENKMAFRIFSCETDIVVKFFAGAIIRLSHTSQEAEDLWPTEYADHKLLSLKHLYKNATDWIQGFNLYMRETEKHSRINTRASMRRATQAKLDSIAPCHLVQHLTISGREYVKDRILAAKTTDALIFFIPAKDAFGEHFQYIEIPLRCISLDKSPFINKYDSSIHCLQLHFHKKGYISIDGQKQEWVESDFSMTSDDDLAGLFKSLHESDKHLHHKFKRNGSKKGRMSSTLVNLDSGDDIARKSIQYCEENSQTEDPTSKPTPESRPNRLERSDQKPASELIPRNQAGDTSSPINENSAMNDNLSTNTDKVLDATKRNIGQHSLKIRAPSISRHSNGKRKRNSVHVNVHLAAKVVRNDDLNDPGPAMKKKTNPSNAMDIDDEGLEAELEERHPSNTSVKLSQKKSDSSKGSEKAKSSTGNKGRARFADTQESLIFPRPHRTKRKVYTGQSKPVVDWDEHLRPSDECDETLGPEDPELTSIPSPSPGETSVFDKISNISKRKRKSKDCPSNEKAKRPTKRKTANDVKKNEKNARVPLHSTEANVDKRRPDNTIGEENEEINCEMIYGDISEKIAMNRLTETGSPFDYTAHIMFSNDKSIPVIGEMDYAAIVEARSNAPSSELVEEDWLESGDANDRDKNANTQNDGQSQARESTKAGRGQTVGEKLAAALYDRAILLESQPDTTQGSNSIHGELEEVSAGSPFPIEEDPENKESQSQQSFIEFDTAMKDERSLLHAKGHNDLNTSDSTILATKREISGKQLSKHMDTSQRSEMENVSLEEKGTTGKSSPSYPKTHSHGHAHPTNEYSPLVGGIMDSEGLAQNIRVDLFSELTTDREEDLTTDTKNSKAEFCQHRDSVRTVLKPFPNVSQPESPTFGSSQSSLRRATIVDENGSPRRISRQNIAYSSDSGTSTGMERSRKVGINQTRSQIEQGSNESGYDGDSDGNATDYSPTNRAVISTFRRKLAAEFRKRALGSHNPPKSSSEDGNTSDNTSDKSINHVEHSPSSVDCIRASIKKSNLPVSTANLTKPNWLPTRSQARLGQKATDRQNSAHVSSVQPDLVVEESNGLQVSPHQVRWEASLQAIQKSAQASILKTSERLMRDVEHEKSTVSRALESYRDGCYRVLDHFFEAQEQRIELYRQQMASVKKLHADLSRDLIRRLEENDQRIQEKALMDNSVIGEAQSSARGLLDSSKQKAEAAIGHSYSPHSSSSHSQDSLESSD